MTWTKVAAHVHSTWSYDGEWSLEDIARVFTRFGYDAVLMAEHDPGFDEARWQEYRLACEAASTSAIRLIPGIEYQDPDNVVHTIVWGENVPFLGSKRSTLETLRAASEHETATLMAHPWRRKAIERFEPQWAPLLSATEIWNRKSDGIAPRPPAKAFAQAHRLTPFVSLDFHCARQFFPLAMAIEVDTLTTTAIVRSIRNGNCRPEFAGMSALRFTDGPQGASMRAVERVRRALRTPLRKLRHRTA
jgi:predicted metal-dependent phosphoesterase TrpH